MTTATRIPWWRPETGTEEREMVLRRARQQLSQRRRRDDRVRAADGGGARRPPRGRGHERHDRDLPEPGGARCSHGDEVVVPDVTFIATANAVTLAGATPVFVDVDPATLGMDPDAFAARDHRRAPSAVVPVHVSGRAPRDRSHSRHRRRARHRRGRGRRRGAPVAAPGPMPRHVRSRRLLLVLAEQDDHDGTGRARSSPTMTRWRSVCAS